MQAHKKKTLLAFLMAVSVAVVPFVSAFNNQALAKGVDPAAPGVAAGEAAGAPKGAGEVAGAPRKAGEAAGAVKGAGEAAGAPKGAGEVAGAPRKAGEAAPAVGGNAGALPVAGEAAGAAKGAGEAAGAANGATPAVGEVAGAPKGAGETAIAVKGAEAAAHQEAVTNIVNKLDAVAANEAGTVGAKVGNVIKEQTAAKQNATTAINAIEQRNPVVTFFVGADTKNTETLKAEIAATKVNEAELTAAAQEAVNPADKQVLLSQADALKAEQTRMEKVVTAQENAFSLFGWVAKMFAKKQ